MNQKMKQFQVFFTEFINKSDVNNSITTVDSRASSPRLPSEISDNFSDSEATIADNNFTSTKRKVIRTTGGLQRAARRGPRTRGGCAHRVVGP